jgi:hypothetical protein
LSKDFTETDRLRLRQLASHAVALGSAARTFAPYIYQLEPAAWMKRALAEMLVELKDAIPDEEFLRHFKKSGINFDDPEKLDVQNYVELVALTTLVTAATAFWAEETPQMGFHVPAGP